MKSSVPHQQLLCLIFVGPDVDLAVCWYYSYLVPVNLVGLKECIRLVLVEVEANEEKFLIDLKPNQ